ncbi:MAG: adenine deaminase C-terminal domain-containing protein [Armatimonadota bacterium]|nr:adenine deaminase C-terminal domain-containing protein [Armatimonadota bacterium]MDR7440097.1 adenine deaminase C-terminal domain-containing protein [Armatimonadota bacterium]MDR7563585.1 adenine deaminase C-terminal domain-containing protein [Armatimonadota bacterium]MDR7567805.1 adenine deaminase C-terminal domain-containing protein [Armatimonadota bacterium]MDR7602197.1 adenine deaminase C-terminal domain-containing protein [Armatimonadota bacterium]
MPGRPTEAVVRRMRVAQGLEPADLVVCGAVVVNVYTGELHPDSVIATSGDRIAYVGPPLEGLAGETTQVLDAEGRYAVPGLIDGHTHLLGARYCPEEALPYILASGTTSVVTELAELASVAGLLGIRAGMEAVRDQPVKVFVTLPPLAGAASFMEDVAPEVETYRGLMQRPEVVGLGEVYWGNLVLREDPRILELVWVAREAGKVVEGHGAGARGGRLAAYAAAGITSCHEPITAEEVLERLRMGYRTMVREGKVRQEMEAVAPVWREGGVDLRRLCLVTDSVAADQLLEQGYMDHLLRKAIRLGMDPVRAVQAVTLNVAEHFRLDHLIGGLAPGRYADFVLTPDLRDFRAEVVVANGRVVAEGGRALVPFRPPRYPEALYRTVPSACLVPPDALRVPAPGRKGAVRVRAIRMVTHLVTQEAVVELPVDGEAVRIPPDADVAFVAAVDRVSEPGRAFVGFVQGLGMRAGGHATTMAWDAHCLVAVGRSPEDMALAIRRVVEMQGGCAVTAQGEVLAELPAPVAGVVSTLPLGEVARREREVDRALRDLGVHSPRPSLTIDILTAAAIPHLKVSERGYVWVRDGRVVGLWPEEG